MSDFREWMKENKQKKENTFYAATKTLCDKDGKPLKWEIRSIDTEALDRLQDKCTYQEPIGKDGNYVTKVNYTKLQKLMLCEAVVNPDLDNKDLQDSYRVKSAEALITKMVDDPVEYAEFVDFVSKFTGYKTMKKEIEEAKNS